MIFNGRIQIFLRRRQNQAPLPTIDDPVVNVIVSTNPGTGEAMYVAGDVDNTTPFMDITPVDGWYDFSNYIEDQNKMSFTWDKVNQGDSKNSSTSEQGSNYDKGITASLMFFDKAAQFVHDWLLLFDYQVINCVEVKMIDLIARQKNPDPAGNYRIFEVKADALNYLPQDEPCQYHVKLREQDLVWHCIHKTPIVDDWQHWFNKDGTSTFAHPTFLTCIEPRPRLVQSVRMALMFLFHGAKTITFPISLVIDWITDAPSRTEDCRRVLNANRFVDAPFVNTYIQNVALKCGMTTDTIFDTGREWEKLCIYFPRSGEMHESDDDAVVSPAQTFHWENRWLITVPDLLDRLKVLFCAEWYVTPQNKIVFAYKKDLNKLDPIYDFTVDNALPFFHLEYSFNGNKRPAYGEYKYQVDPVDQASQEINALYSESIGFDETGNNPMLEGELQRDFDFAATGFVRDGRAKDYMKVLINDGKYGALILLAIVAIVALGFFVGAITAPLGLLVLAMTFVAATAIAKEAKDFMTDFVDGPDADIYTGAVRMTAEQATVARVLLYDGVQTDRAKVVRRTTLPIVNEYYNQRQVKYDIKNKINKDNPNEYIFNYPLYFDADYYGNMFINYFDVIDNPLKSKESNQQAKFQVELCEFMQNLLGFFEGQYVQIGKLMKLEERDNYDVFVRIGNILEDYSSSMITITGNVIRRPSSGAQPPDDQTPGNLPVPVPEDPDPTPPPISDLTCYRWFNTGTVASTVTYIDCDGNTVTDAVIAPDEHFCAREIVAQDPATINSTASCDNTQPPFPGGDCDKIYRACIHPAFIDDGTPPSVIVHENTLGGDVVWTRDSAGVYLGTLVGAFPQAKTWYQGNNPIPPSQGTVIYRWFSDDQLFISTFDPSGTESDFIAGESCLDIEVIVYCNDCTPPDVAGFLASLDSNPCLDQDIVLALAAPGVPDGDYIVNWTATNVVPTSGSQVVSFVSGNATLNLGFKPDGLGATTVTVVDIQDILLPAACVAAVNIEVDFTTVGAIAYAGADAVTVTDYTITDATAIGDVVSVLWTTSGDGTFDDPTLVNPTYTPGSGDTAAATVTLTMTITTSEGGACATSVDSMVLAIYSYLAFYNITTLSNAFNMSFTLQGFPALPAIFIDWGDGSPLEEFTLAGTLSPSHTYATAGDYDVTVYMSNAALATFFGATGVDVRSFNTTLSTNFMNNLTLFGVLDQSTVMPPNEQNIHTLHLEGSPNSVQTVMDFSGFPLWTNMTTLVILGFPAVTTIVNINDIFFNPIGRTIDIESMPSLTDLDSGNRLQRGSFSAFDCDDLNYAGLPTFNWTSATGITFNNGTFSVSDINQLLQDVDAAGTSGPGRFFQSLGQVPAATPTGAGATAKANLLARGWSSVLTD